MKGIQTLAGWSRTKIKLIQYALLKEREGLYPMPSGKEIV